MKIKFLIISLLALTFLLFNCKKTTSTPNDGSDNNGDSNNTGSIPVLSSGNAISITSHSAKSGGKITSDGGKNIIAKGICWDLSPSPTITKNKTVDGSGTDEFTSQMNDLEYNTTYYVRSYATNSVGTAYGNEISFTTLFPFKFGPPQFIDTYYSGIDFGYNSIYIPSSGVIYNRYSSSWQINKAPKVFSDPVFTFKDIPTYTYRTEKAKYYRSFAVDNKDENIYAEFGGYLYVGNIPTKSQKVFPLDIGANGTLLKVMQNDDVVLTSENDNGSILKITAGTNTIQTVISRLGAVPIGFDQYNSYYYYTLDYGNTTGVWKISTNGGAATKVVGNVISPSRIVFDKKGNFILVDKITINQEDYCQFSIYNSAGKKIQDITDNSGKKILEAFTGGHQAIPLYIDPNNNLYFAHKEFNDKNNLCNPNRKGGDYTNYFDIYKIQLIEQ